MRFHIYATMVPEPSYEGVEWWWKARVTEAAEDDEDWIMNESHDIEAKYGFASRDEAEADLAAGLPAYLSALQEERTKDYFINVEAEEKTE